MSDHPEISEVQVHCLLEKLRQKSIYYPTVQDALKSVRSAINERKVATDISEKSQYQVCLDSLQTKIKVTSLQSMVERLEAISRQLGLNLTKGPSGMEWFISSDMFYLEVILDATGVVKDVKIQHEGYKEQQSCPEMVECLSRGNFSSLNKHLEGLAHIYKLSTDSQEKSNIFMAINALESDLYSIFAASAPQNDATSIFYSPVGLVQKRRGGLWCQLYFLLSPYDLFDETAKGSIPMSVENIFQKELGYYVKVTIEKSETPQKLQISPILTKMNESQLPAFAPLGMSNSVSLPCCFSLHFDKPLPLCVNLLKQITEITGIDIDLPSPPSSLFGLVASQNDESGIDVNSPLFVSLPDQEHCYFLNEGSELEAVLISAVPFIHPSHVHQILTILRKQALVNVLIDSCIRPKSKKELNAITFEVTAVSVSHLSIGFEHPNGESLCNATFDLSDLGSLRCQIYSSGGTDTVCSADFASRVLQRCLSIPVTMRAIIRQGNAFPNWTEELNTTAMNVDQSDSGQYDTSVLAMERFSREGTNDGLLSSSSFGIMQDLVKGHLTSVPNEGAALGDGKREQLQESKEPNSISQGVLQSDEIERHDESDRTLSIEAKQPPDSKHLPPIPGLTFPPIPPLITSDLINPVASTSLASLAMGLSMSGPLMSSLMPPDYAALFSPGRNPLAAQEAYAQAIYGLQNMRGMTSPSRKRSKGESNRSPKRLPYEDMLMPDPGKMDPALAAFSAFGGMGGLGYGGINAANAQFFASLAALNRLPPMTAQPSTHTPPLIKSEPTEVKIEEAFLKKEKEELRPESEQKCDKSEKDKKHREKHDKRSDSKFSLEIDKGSTYPSVSITPITSSTNTAPPSSSFASLGLERRPGIEIIPLTNPPSSMSVTAVPKNERKERREEKKKEERDEKRDRKRKADEALSIKPAKVVSLSSGVMGPPATPTISREISAKQPSLSVSVKTGALSPVTSSGSGISTPNSPSSKSKSSSPNSKNKVSMSPSHQSASSSPKTTNSPKRSSSPKHVSASPKHSGKPSMSALKTISSSSKESSGNNKHKAKDKSREKKSSTPTPETPKSKSLNKTKSFEIIEGSGDEDEEVIALLENNISQDLDQSGDSKHSQGSGSDSSSSKSPVRNRKSSLSAVIDKLTRQQNPAGEGKEGSKDKKDNEFVVKQRSSQGIKLTFNKTKAGERSSSNSSNSSKDSTDSGSVKSSSGLKPGTTSGPASKKLASKSASSKSPSHSSNKTSSDRKEREKDRDKYKSRSNDKSKGEKSSSTRPAENKKEKIEVKPKFDSSFQIPKISKEHKNEKKDESRKENVESENSGTTTKKNECKIDDVHEDDKFSFNVKKEDTKKEKNIIMPLSPSVQIHIVKSPVPRNSPMTMHSPKPQPSSILAEEEGSDDKAK
ncbi:mediator of RNA polymerase II transcription subunit 1-like [Artemia franciscana]|uniref:Mediator of RNA polymerase II transcription subunit 1 n=1 Tax=Artemia franciscana TaxID=6661 RepID=A0AA88LLM5_ARTSF|nr:hypothetical protein QYM36_007508 [Artemia franciscana]